MQVRSAEFISSYADVRKCAAPDKPEFAFIGRSNVGKSSLINMLTNSRHLAKTSATPGKTQTINHFLINKEWYLVDLPGYGYAAVGEQRRLEFNAAVADFLSGRRNLRCVFVLIDSRLPPQAIDLEFVRWLAGCTVPFAFVFTKTDKQSAAQGQANIALFKKAVGEFRADVPDILTSSARTRAGRREILNYVSDTLAKHNRSAG